MPAHARRPAPRTFRPLRAALLATLLATLAALVAAQRPDAGADRSAASPQGVAANPARACVTRRGICPLGAIAPARAGDPCGCPHPLRGTVPGHVERVEGGDAPPLARAGGRDWPAQDPDAGDPPPAGPGPPLGR